MARELRKNVTVARYVDGRATGGSQSFGPDYPAPLPDWAREQLKDADVWTDSVAASEPEMPEPDKPIYEMRKAELVAYADKVGVDSSGTMDDIKERIEAKEG